MIEKESITYNILVTGGAGFIGSHIVEELLKKEVFFKLPLKEIKVEFKIFILDNFSTGKMENIEDFLNHDNVRLIKGDLTDYKFLLELMLGMDYIIHQGALGSVPRSFDEPKLYAQHNIIATMNIFNIAEIYKDKIKGIVQASSSSVYGDTEELPKHEEMNVTPKSPYAFSKLVCEEMAHNFNTRTRIPVTSLRYFNVFGARQNLNGIYSPVIPNFINAINNNEPCIIHGDGTQTRDFTYVLDLVQGLIKGGFYEEAIGENFNLAAGREISISDMAEMVNKTTGNNAELIFKERRKWDTKPRLLASIEKAQKLIKYEPIIDFEEGFNANIAWFNENWKLIKSLADFKPGMNSAVRK